MSAVDSLRQVGDNATDAPWAHSIEASRGYVNHSVTADVPPATVVADVPDNPFHDGEFIATARNVWDALLDVAAEVDALTEWVDGIRYCRVCDRWVPELVDHVNDDPSGPCPVAPVLAALDRLNGETS